MIDATQLGESLNDLLSLFGDDAVGRIIVEVQVSSITSQAYPLKYSAVVEKAREVLNIYHGEQAERARLNRKAHL